MIVRRSILDTIINLYKPYIMDNCIKFVSKLQFLTFCDGVKIKKELNLSDLALSLCCQGRKNTICHDRRSIKIAATAISIMPSTTDNDAIARNRWFLRELYNLFIS